MSGKTIAQDGPANPNVELGTSEFNCRKCGKPILLCYEAGPRPSMGIISETLRCPWDCGHEWKHDLPGKLRNVERGL